MTNLKEEFQPLDKYLSDAKKYIFKRAPILKNDEDAIAYVAYWGMIGDQRFDSSKNDSRDGFRALYYSFGLKKFFRNRRKKKDAINIAATSLDEIRSSKSSSDRKLLDNLQAKPIEKHEDYIEIINHCDFLSESRKNIAILYWVYGYSTREIAEKMSVSHQRITQQLDRITDLFKENQNNVRD